MGMALTGSNVQPDFSWDMILTGVLVAQLSPVPMCFPVLIYLAKLTYIDEINY